MRGERRAARTHKTFAFDRVVKQCNLILSGPKSIIGRSMIVLGTDEKVLSCSLRMRAQRRGRFLDSSFRKQPAFVKETRVQLFLIFYTGRDTVLLGT